MSQKWLLTSIIIAWVIVLLLPQVIPARAQESTPESDANCIACHEHQYYLYDNGKWFCLCDAPMHCVYCHDGRTDTSVKEQAHQGLVLYPTHNHAERCQTCHSEDYMSRVVTFANVAGISSTPQPIITATPVRLTTLWVEDRPPMPFLRFNQLETIQQLGLGVLGIVMAGILTLGYCCWKADCRAKS